MESTEERPGPARRGRRRGDETTREAILDAALEQFATHGYDRATVRAIAGAAGTDPGMIRHWFGAKEGLFAATVLDRTPTASVLRAELADVRPGRGRRLAAAYLSLWESPESGPMLRALVRSSVTAAEVPPAVRRALGGGIMDRAYAGDRGERGIVMAGSHLLGIALTRYVVRLPHVETMPMDDLLDELGPVIDGYLDRD